MATPAPAPDVRPTLALEVRGITFRVAVTNGGIFTTEYQGRNFTAAKLDELRDTLTRATRKSAAKLAIEFTYENGHDAVVTGIHGATGAALVRFVGKSGELESGSTQQSTYDLRNKTLRRLDSNQHHHLAALMEAVAKATDDLNAFRRLHAFDVWEEVLKAARATPEESQS